MTKRSRIVAIVALAGQLLLVGGSPLVDARQGGQPEAADVRVHVEDADLPPCGGAHLHLACLLCRTLQSLNAPRGSVRLTLFPAISPYRPAFSPAPSPTSARLAAGLRARAPPA